MPTVEEVEEMSQAVSASTARRYGLALVCRVWEFSRATFYRNRRPASQPPRGRRGPRGGHSDEELLRAIREDLETSPWVGEGHRKVHARLRSRGIRTSKRRVLRLMREAQLLAPSRAGRPHGPKAHDGSIIPDQPDQLWGTDATSTLTGEGNAGIFFVIDHCTAECMGIHAARPATRFEALEPLRQAVERTFGRYGEAIAGASGLSLRHDHGSQFISDVYQDELRFLGIESSASFVREPEGNGCAERFVRTLKEQLLWLHHFDTVDELNRALTKFTERYNEQWLIQRHGHRSPNQQRRLLSCSEVAA